MGNLKNRRVAVFATDGGEQVELLEPVSRPWRSRCAGVAQTRSDEPFVQDHQLVTSRKPQDIPGFNQAMIELFAKAEARR